MDNVQVPPALILPLLLLDLPPPTLPGYHNLIKVSVRIRPLIREEREVEALAWLWESNTISADLTRFPQRQTTLSRSAAEQIQSHTPTASYLFDNLFCPEHSNEQIFNKIVKPMTAKAMQGYHGSIFSYGQVHSSLPLRLSPSPLRSLSLSL
jgi:hypothetical protein